MRSHRSSTERPRAAAPLSAPQRLGGRATPEGTARFAARHAARFADDFFRPLDGMLRTGSLGLGSYLGESDDAEDARYAATARAALERGVNLLDAAINYRCQRSERALGRALAAAVADGTVRRDEVVVCTKGGFVPLDGAPPASRAEYDDYLAHEFYRPGVMRPDDVVAAGHCLAPGFLAHQIERSRANLGVETLDVYYLHTPEQQLAALPRERVRARLRAAFEMLEAQVAAGTIARYGCATWQGLRVSVGTRGHLALAELVATAREVAGEGHHFRVVQLPISLAMPEALRAPTQPLGSDGAVPLLEAAAALGIDVIACTPLAQSQLAAGLPAAVRDAFPPTLRTDAQRALAFVRSLPAVASALVGMRSEAHLDENLAAAARV